MTDQVYRCLVSLGEATKYCDMHISELTNVLGLSKAFEINVSTMPLAQTPPRNLLILIKMHSEDNQQAWIRLNLTRPQSKELIDQLMGSLT